MVALGSCALHAKPVISSGRGAVVLLLELLLLLSLIQSRPINDMDELQRSYPHQKIFYVQTQASVGLIWVKMMPVKLKEPRGLYSRPVKLRGVFMCHIRVEKLLIVRMNDSSRLARHGQFLDLGFGGFQALVFD